MLIKYPSRPVFVTPILLDRDIIKSVARKNYQAAAKHILEYCQLRGFITAALGQEIHNELKQATGANSTSVITNRDAHTLTSFSWENLTNDLAKNCGKLFNILQLCIPQRKRDISNGVICLIIAMLAKQTNQRARYMETVLSLMLLSGHATNQVFMCRCKCNITST